MSRINVDQIYTRTGTGSPIIREMPVFYAYRSGTQSITSSIDTTIQLNAELYDTEGWFNTSLYQYIPQIAGYYQFNWGIYIRATSGATRGLCTLIKNNSATDYVRGAYLPAFNGTDWNASGGTLMYMNGTTDYVEIRGYLTATSPVVQGTNAGDTFLCGFLVRPD
jgi:hypothetical protein